MWLSHTIAIYKAVNICKPFNSAMVWHDLLKKTQRSWNSKSQKIFPGIPDTIILSQAGQIQGFFDRFGWIQWPYFRRSRMAGCPFRFLVKISTGRFLRHSTAAWKGVSFMKSHRFLPGGPEWKRHLFDWSHGPKMRWLAWALRAARAFGRWKQQALGDDRLTTHNFL